MTEPLLSVENLSMHYPVRTGFAGRTRELVKAVDNVSFSINSGETFGLVGESGCGKTTTGKCVLRINEPTSGRIVFKGQDLAHASRRVLAPFRRKLQLIFQDPYSSLDPRQTASSMLAEAITGSGEAVSRAALREKIAALLATVELPEAMGRRYPHEMSGGQRQRLGIARALACAPDLVICDEPVAALDVSIQAQIINLFKSIQKQTGVTYLFIAHDLAVVRHVSDRIGVMYLGRLVEVTTAEALYIGPRHPYTKALLSAIPITDYYEERKRSRIVLQGEVPSPMTVPPGCPFHPRCGYATAECRIAMPELRDIGNGHSVACHNA